MINRRNQLHVGEAYSRPFVPVGAVTGLDEVIIEALSAGDEGRGGRQL